MVRRGATPFELAVAATLLALGVAGAVGLVRGGRPAGWGVEARNAVLDAGRTLSEALKRDLRHADPWAGDGFTAAGDGFRVATGDGLAVAWRFDAAAGRAERSEPGGALRTYGDREVGVAAFRVSPVAFRTDLKVTRGFTFDIEVVERSAPGGNRLRLRDLVVPPGGRRPNGVRFGE